MEKREYTQWPKHVYLSVQESWQIVIYTQVKQKNQHLEEEMREQKVTGIKRQFRKHFISSFKSHSVKQNTIFPPALTCWRRMQILNMLGFVRRCLKGRGDSPVCAACPTGSAAYSGRRWRSSRRGDARRGADWQPAERLWLQAPVTTANPPWNWTRGGISKNDTRTRVIITQISGTKMFFKVSPAGPVLTVSEELQLLR